jgi:hypothetical protein
VHRHPRLMPIISLFMLLVLLSRPGQLFARAEVQAVASTTSPNLLSQIGGGSLAVDYVSGYVFMGVGPRLYILEIKPESLSTPPVLVGTSEILPGIVQDVKVAGSNAYVALGEGGLAVINVLYREDPVLVSIFDTAGFARGLWIDFPNVYVADGATGVLKLDATDPAAIQLTFTYETPGIARDVLISNAGSDSEKLFIADGYAGLRVLNLIDGNLIDSDDTPGYAEALTILDPYIYIADGEAGLELYKISANDTIFDMLFQNETPGYAQDVMIHYPYIYVADGTGGLRIFNRDAELLLAKGSYENPSGLASGLEMVFVGVEPYILLADYSGLAVVTVIDQMYPTLLASYNNPAVPARLAVSGADVFIADHLQGLRVISTANPGLPVLTGWYDNPGEANDVAVLDQTAYLADGEAGLQVIDISDPETPVKTAITVDTPGAALAVTVEGDTAYLADGEAGLVGIPPTMSVAGIFDTPGVAMDVAVAGDYAYIADGANGLVVVNRYPLASMTLAGWLDTPGSATALALQGDYAYLADGDKGLRIIDITNPQAPAEVGFYDTAGKAVDVAAAGDLVYVAEKDNGVRVFDVSDPALPVSVLFYETLGAASGVAVNSGYVYVADEQGGLLIFSTSYALMLPIILR